MDTNEQNKQKLWETIYSLKTGMLVTEEAGKFSGRPMTLVQESFDGKLWFFTERDTKKVEEIKKDRNIGLSFIDTKYNQYVFIQGKAKLTTDKTLVDKFWSPFVATWIDGDKDDSNFLLIEVDVESAEIWNGSTSSTETIYQFVKSQITGEKPSLGSHQTLN